MKLIRLCLLFIALSATTILADQVYLKDLRITGNRITKKEYIMRLIDLKVNKSYDVDRLMDKMSIIKDRLYSTGLFENVFFDDQIDENNNLILTVKLREKNYLHFGPSGRIYYKDALYPDIGLYIDYLNLLGRNNRLYINTPMYENQGIAIKFQNDPMRNYQFTALLKYLVDKSNRVSESSIKSFTVVPEITFSVFNDFEIGSSFTYNRYNGSSFLFAPELSYSSNQKSKRHITLDTSIILGAGEQKSVIYGISSRANYKQELLLQMSLKVNALMDFLDGDVPKNLELTNRSRGYPYGYLSGNKRFYFTSEISFPLPWSPNISIAIFVDSDIIGYNNLKSILSGGAGLKLYSRFFNPLNIDLIVGKGIEINFNNEL